MLKLIRFHVMQAITEHFERYGTGTACARPLSLSCLLLRSDCGFTDRLFDLRIVVAIEGESPPVSQNTGVAAGALECVYSTEVKDKAACDERYEK